MSKIILLDGDVLCYRCAWSEKDSSAAEAVLKLEELISNIIGEVDPWGSKGNRYFFLTGKGNYRYDIAKTAVYKGNRKDTPKPQHLGILRTHMMLKFDAIVSEGNEADDLIGIYANRSGYDNVVVVSIDKDFEQLPTTIFNPTKWEWKTVDPWTATKNFYKQILMGDRVDNIIGIYGIGPAKADVKLQYADTESGLYHLCVNAYVESLATHDGHAYDWAVNRVLENGRLLWIQREPNQLWGPPI
jgi:hypothetical protein